jgi:hypothetical protein
MADFPYTLTRNPVSAPVAATTFVYASDAAFSVARTRAGLPAGQFGTYIWQYQIRPVNGSAPTNNFPDTYWRLIWISATVFDMYSSNDGINWVLNPAFFGALNPTSPWQFINGYGIQNIVNQAYQFYNFTMGENQGIEYVKNNYATTYKVNEIVTFNGGAYENNTSTHLFDVRILATANLNISQPMLSVA